MNRSMIGIAVLLVACGGSAPGPDASVADGSARDAPPTDAPGGATVAEVVARIGHAACAAARECSGAEVAWEQGYTSAAHCEAWFALRWSHLAPSDRIVVDAAAVDGCLAAIDETVCELGSMPDTTEWPAACTAALHGTVASGGACESTAECDHGTCACDGICHAWVTDGSDCSAAPCLPGSTCDATRHCVAPAPVAHVGESCSSAACAGVLRCVLGTCTEARDLRTVALGGACENPFDAPADPDHPMWCAAGLECDFDGGSVCVGPSTVGAPCDTGGASPFCPEGTSCHGPAGSATCAPYQAEGETCFESGRGGACAPGLRCGSDTCDRIGDVGDACAWGEDCATHACTAGVCALPERSFCS
jgi:hypothetical protein